MLYGTMCHHWETDRLEELEAELEETVAEPRDAEDAGEQDDQTELIEVPSADD